MFVIHHDSCLDGVILAMPAADRSLVGLLSSLPCSGPAGNDRTAPLGCWSAALSPSPAVHVKQINPWAINLARLTPTAGASTEGQKAGGTKLPKPAVAVQEGSAVSLPPQC